MYILRYLCIIQGDAIILTEKQRVNQMDEEFAGSLLRSEYGCYKGSVAEFIDQPERPIRRNPKIARILYYSKDIESFGTGLKRIADACDCAGVKYEFKNLKSGFVVCFYRSEEEDKESEKADKEPEKADKEPEKADKKSTKFARYRMIVEYVTQNDCITNKKARELLGLADSTTKRVLKGMADEGILVVEGERKARKYRLNHTQIRS